MFVLVDESLVSEILTHIQIAHRHSIISPKGSNADMYSCLYSSDVASKVTRINW